MQQTRQKKNEKHKINKKNPNRLTNAKHLESRAHAMRDCSRRT